MKCMPSSRDNNYGQNLFNFASIFDQINFINVHIYIFNQLLSSLYVFEDYISYVVKEFEFGITLIDYGSINDESIWV